MTIEVVDTRHRTLASLGAEKVKHGGRPLWAADAPIAGTQAIVVREGRRCSARVAHSSAPGSPAGGLAPAPRG
jgi:hypothetical protein